MWGYSTVAFMAPMSRYGTPGAGPAAAAREFKTMVKARLRLRLRSCCCAPRLRGGCTDAGASLQELHRAGIEVILDVVYNHTAEARGQGMAAA